MVQLVWMILRWKALAGVLNCKVLSFPFMYLGILIGANPRRRSTWRLIIDKYVKKLSFWKHKQLSLTGCICLINSILSSLPLFFRIPSSVVKKI